MIKLTQNNSRINIELEQEHEFFAKGSHGEIHNATGTIEDRITGEKFQGPFAVKYFTDPTKKDAEEEMVGHNFKHNVRVYAQGVKNGREYIVMEKTNGTLLSKMRKLDFIASLTPNRITEILLQVGHGIEEARYKLGYEAHLDVAERNIHILDGIVKLADYGVAKTSDKKNIERQEDGNVQEENETDFFEVTETETIDATSFKPYHTTKPKDTIHPEVKTGSEGKQLHDIYSLLTLGQNLMKELNGFIRINTATDEQLSNREQLNRICGFASNLDPSTYVKEEHFKDMSKFLEYLSEQMGIEYEHGDLRAYWTDIDTYRFGGEFSYGDLKESCVVALNDNKDKLTDGVKKQFSSALQKILGEEKEKYLTLEEQAHNFNSSKYKTDSQINKAIQNIDELRSNIDSKDLEELSVLCVTATEYGLDFEEFNNWFDKNNKQKETLLNNLDLQKEYMQFKLVVVSNPGDYYSIRTALETSIQNSETKSGDITETYSKTIKQIINDELQLSETRRSVIKKYLTTTKETDEEKINTGIKEIEQEIESFEKLNKFDELSALVSDATILLKDEAFDEYQ